MPTRWRQAQTPTRHGRCRGRRCRWDLCGWTRREVSWDSVLEISHGARHCWGLRWIQMVDMLWYAAKIQGRPSGEMIWFGWFGRPYQRSVGHQWHFILEAMMLSVGGANCLMPWGSALGRHGADLAPCLFWDEGNWRNWCFPEMSHGTWWNVDLCDQMFWLAAVAAELGESP